MKLGFGELLIIFVVILFIIGPDKIPSFAKKLGEGLRAFRSATSDVTKEIKENVVDPLNEAQAPLREAMEPLTEMKEEINKSVRDIKKDVAGLNNVNAPKKTIEVGESAPEEGEAAPAPVKKMKTIHVYDSNLEEAMKTEAPKAAPKVEAASAPQKAEAPAQEAPAEAPSGEQAE